MLTTSLVAARLGLTSGLAGFVVLVSFLGRLGTFGRWNCAVLIDAPAAHTKIAPAAMQTIRVKELLFILGIQLLLCSLFSLDNVLRPIGSHC
jgi:hypothetical protein